MIQKRLGQLSDGDQAYLKLTKRGKIYGQVITNGAVTGRCTHHSPNLAQVCSSDLPYGKELRALFTATSNMDMCGVDFSGLELRVLGHYLCVYDNGYFLKTLLEDDIHTPIKNYSDYPHVLKLKLLYMLTFTVGEIRNSVKYLTSLMKKPKE